MKKLNFSFINNKLKYECKCFWLSVEKFHNLRCYVSIMSDRLNIEIERIKKLLECPICFEKYVNTLLLYSILIGQFDNIAAACYITSPLYSLKTVGTYLNKNF
jgi:hypothetical protein